jgi:hypothetical protein
MSRIRLMSLHLTMHLTEGLVHLTQEERDEMLLSVVKGMGVSLAIGTSNGNQELAQMARDCLSELEAVMERIYVSRGGPETPTTPTKGST